MFRVPAVAVTAILALAPSVVFGGPIGYIQTNLTSDIVLPQAAANIDPNLKNPWGMSFSPTSPFWVSDQMTDVATLYNAAGVPQALVVSVPPAPTGQGPAGPTGQVFVGGSGFTTLAAAAPVFAFATLAGTIDAWNSGGSAATQFTASDGAVYTGLALGNNGSANFLYAADTKNGKIDVFDSSFHKTAVLGTFADPSVSAGFTPYNIQNVGGKLYVEYAKQGAPGGFVGVFDANGNLLQHLADSHFNAPWGVTLAPAGFGDFGSDLLVGNFGDGLINALDPTTGAFVGTLMDANGNPIINSGLWALAFRQSGSGFDPNALYFAAGINGEADGLFGRIQPAAVPEPATLTMLGLAFGALASRKLRRAGRGSRP